MKRQILTFKCWLMSYVFMQSEENNEMTMLVNVVPHKSKGTDGVFNHNLELESIIF